MKPNLHPVSKPTIFVDTSCGAEFLTMSTLSSNETRTIDGTKYQVVNTEISSASHPFYTGKQILVDTARRVEKFQERAAKRAAASTERKGKKIKRAKLSKAKISKEVKKKTVAPEKSGDETK